MKQHDLLLTLLSIIKGKDNIKCLLFKRYLCEMYPYIWSIHICDLAAKIGDIPLMIYLCERGYEWNDRTMHQAAAGGQLECIKYMHKHNVPWNANLIYFAAAWGHFECIKYAHENGCTWDCRASEEAAKRGDLECFKYLHENGCPRYGIVVTFQAAKNGHLDCLRYAHENGYGWNREITEAAAYHQHLDCLQYACENGCYWILIDGIPRDFNGSLPLNYYFLGVSDEEIYEADDEPNLRKRYEHLRYKHKEGCEWKNWSLVFAKHTNFKNFLEYAREHKCKCSSVEHHVQSSDSPNSSSLS